MPQAQGNMEKSLGSEELLKLHFAMLVTNTPPPTVLVQSLNLEGLEVPHHLSDCLILDWHTDFYQR